MKHCESCNIVHVNLECPLCAANTKIKELRVVVKVAPIMLEALKEITGKCSELDYPDCCLIARIAQAAIDAAEGKE